MGQILRTGWTVTELGVLSYQGPSEQSTLLTGPAVASRIDFSNGAPSIIVQVGWSADENFQDLANKYAICFANKTANGF